MNIENSIKNIITNITNVKYNLSPEQIAWIKYFVSLSPNTLEIILTDIQNIIKDGKIDLHDIPMIVKLVADIYHTDIKKLSIRDSKNLIVIIKYTLNILIDTQYIELSLEEKEKITNVLDASLYLLSMNIKTNEKSKYCFYWF